MATSGRITRPYKIQDEGRFLKELIDGLVHEFPLCCTLAYSSDIYFRHDAKPAAERGVVPFRTFSIFRAENLFNGLDKVAAPDHFVPCKKCARRLRDRRTSIV